MRKRSPIGAWVRGTRAQRRVGMDASCPSCGEDRPYALIAGRVPPCCYRCERLAQGGAPYEDNHVFGQRNSDLKIRYPINDHRAVLSVAQYRWPPGALENTNGSPLQAAIAASYALYDNIEHMLAENRRLALKLAAIEEHLTVVYGPNWFDALEEAAKNSYTTAHHSKRPNTK